MSKSFEPGLWSGFVEGEESLASGRRVLEGTGRGGGRESRGAMKGNGSGLRALD